MAVGTEAVAVRYEDVTAGVPISVPYPLYQISEVRVYYGRASLLATYNTDYTITLGEDFDTFNLTPTTALIDKINALIAVDSTEVNYITVRRRLDYLTEATPAAVRYTPFTSREFDRTILRFQQIQEQLNRSLTLEPGFVGNVALTLPPPIAGRALMWNTTENGLENGPTADEIIAAQAHAQAAAAAQTAAEEAQAAAEEAQAAAEAAIANGLTVVTTIAELAAANVQFGVSFLSHWQRAGTFVLRDASGYTSLIAADTFNGVVVASTVDPTKVWVRERLHSTYTYPLDWWAPAKDAVTDDAPRFNCARAVVALRGGGWIETSAGTYFVGETITAVNGVFFRGQGGTTTNIVRTGSYGHTFYQDTGFAKISGFFMRHGTSPDAGATSLDYRQTNGSAHIYLRNTQDAEISGNILWRMPYCIVNDGAINSRIDQNWLRGWWDNNNVAAQEGEADLAFRGTTQHGQLAKVTRNYFSGSYNGTRVHTFSDGANSVNATIGWNTGSKNCIFATCIEDIDIRGNYFGRSAQTCLRFALTSATNDMLIDLRINENFFDNAGNGYSHITTESLAAGKQILGFVHTGNTHNGEYDTLNAILTTSNTADGEPSVVNQTITGNTMFAFVATPLVLNGTRVGVVTGNTIHAYNALNVGLFAGTNSTFKAGVYVGGSSDNVFVHGNMIGGGGNNAHPTTGNYCYQGVVVESAAGKYNYANDNVLSLVDGSGNPRRGKTTGGVRVMTAGGPSTPQDQVILVQNGTGAALSIALPPYPVEGQRIVIKDASGTAGTHLIQVIPAAGVATIDGAANQNITTAYGSREYIFNGVQWNAA
jgi:hypothetical protein